MEKSNQLSVEIRITENTMQEELVSVNKDCYCVTDVFSTFDLGDRFRERPRETFRETATVSFEDRDGRNARF